MIKATHIIGITNSSFESPKYMSYVSLWNMCVCWWNEHLRLNTSEQQHRYTYSLTTPALPRYNTAKQKASATTPYIKQLAQKNKRYYNIPLLHNYYLQGVPINSPSSSPQNTNETVSDPIRYSLSLSLFKFIIEHFVGITVSDHYFNMLLLHTHISMYIYIYIYICVCVCVCVRARVCV